AAMLGLDDARCRIVAEDAARTLRSRPWEAFDVVFIDPPYGKSLLSPTLKALIRNEWVTPEALVSAEVEVAAPFAAEKAHAQLELLTERA
ncbi:MAG: RsmD family RNA methyltransferase, partial [Desulfovibrionaceae bacterium]|nr:RsmD family RNA methyltransferase [Desulfovibrionaceae bacterium]